MNYFRHLLLNLARTLGRTPAWRPRSYPELGFRDYTQAPQTPADDARALAGDWARVGESLHQVLGTKPDPRPAATARRRAR